MTTGGEDTILVVDDEADVADAYAAQLRERYAVETAYSGESALDVLDESIDVVLLDRRMPGMSGDEVLSTIRERGFGARVAMVTAVEPGFDIVEMPFDDYVVKPVSRGALLETIEHLGRCATYEERIREYYALTGKRAALVANKPRAELAASEEFQSLEREIDAVRETLDEITAGFDETDFEAVFRDLNRASAATE
ncbi:HalX domain-containing protein [Haloarcula nitratireducens]|uniref:HalX domain-containing protein n=1 Tax=Haloarcula nitratireducens TaxID=2487749 RepID=A0AAW4PB14_9EURY|nr:HalX domain-containing protein [Halomicroarcula nitratireducens]MBX0294926.1 HalX domain-containing protein [Halomicroarcula nitratireducens]